MNFLRDLLRKARMRKLWWLVGVGVVLVLCGLFRSANEALTFGLYGTGLMLFGVIGDTIAPTANKVAYFNKATGKRVNPDGTPYYTGAKNFIKSALVTLSFGFIAGMCIYGIGAIVLWIIPKFNFWLLIAFVAVVFLLITFIDGISSYFR